MDNYTISSNKPDRTYPIDDNRSEQKGFLTVCFDKNGRKITTTVKNDNGKRIKRSKIKINDICATYLKGWNKENFWPESAKLTKLEKIYHLTFSNKNIKINLFWHINQTKKICV